MASPETMEVLISALIQQTQSINRLAASNEALVAAMINSEDDGDGDSVATATFLDGSRAAL